MKIYEEWSVVNMAYKIAVGSSDGINVDLKFGEVDEFYIYEVADDIKLVEKRRIPAPDNNATDDNSGNTNTALPKRTCGNSNNTSGCGHGSSCGNGNGGCGGADVIPKVALIDDCRCVVCKKVGFQAQKQFEKKAISVFDVETGIDDALSKITVYYNKIDSRRHIR